MSADFAVDGRADTCTVTPTVVDEPWWAVDLGRDMRVEGLVLYVGNATHSTFKNYITTIH